MPIFSPNQSFVEGISFIQITTKVYWPQTWNLLSDTGHRSSFAESYFEE